MNQQVLLHYYDRELTEILAIFRFYTKWKIKIKVFWVIQSFFYYLMSLCYYMWKIFCVKNSIWLHLH